MSDIQLEERKFIPFVLPAIVFIIAAIILIHYFYTRIYGKFYKNDLSRHYSDIRSWYYGTYKNPLDVSGLVENETSSILANIDSSLNDLEETISELSQKKIEIDETIQDAIIAEILSHANNVNVTNEQIIQMNDLIIKVNDLQIKNSESLQDVKQVYINKLHTYLDDLIRSLDVIQYQYNIASVTSSMNSAMGQLENLYNAIRGTIVKHIDSGFIPDYIDNNLNDPEQIPKLETRNTFDRSGLQNNFGNIGRVFQTYGYT
tara:strand:- start:610 stop:1389 length:780 start_codon:yes stop_codon:yes gene_type:complete